MFILFWDMHSGGGTKEAPYEKIYIEAASEKEAEVIFYNRFGHNPNRVTCTCCGEDYSISNHETLEDASAFHRGCTWNRETQKYNDDGIPIWIYAEDESVLIIYNQDILPEERVGEVPEQGYIWR